MSDIVERARLVQRVNAHWSDSICECEECTEERFGLITPLADEIESLRSRLAEAEALLREALPSVQSHIRKHRRSWEAAMKRGDEFHTRKHCEQMNKDLALESRIDAHLARQP
jgi:hypothetical protein